MFSRLSLIAAMKRSRLRPLFHAIDDRLAIWDGIRRGGYAQHGEDRFVLDYFKGRPGTYVDVGANHPIKISNTYLLYRHGWSGLTVEPIARLAAAHRRHRKRDRLEQILVGPTPGRIPFYQMHGTGHSTVVAERGEESMKAGAVEQVTELEMAPLSTLIDRNLAVRPLDLLTVDTEGFDLQVLKSVDWSRHRPRLVIYEIDENNPGQDLIKEFMTGQNYREIKRLGCNIVLEAGEASPARPA